MNIKLAPVVGRQFQPFKSYRVKLKKKPSEFIGKHGKDSIGTQWPTSPRASKPPCRPAPPTNVCTICRLTFKIQCKIIVINVIIDIIDIKRLKDIIEMNVHLGPLPDIPSDTQTRACIVGGNHGLH